MLLISNNPKALNDDSPQFSGLAKLQIEGSYEDVLTAVRDKIHKGHRLLSHPLSGSVKPNETPYKSVLISKKAGELDLQGLGVIEHSIETCRKFCKDGASGYHGDNQAGVQTGANSWREVSPEILADFAEIDHSLIKSAIISLV